MQKRVELKIETTEKEMRKALEIPDGYYISTFIHTPGWKIRMEKYYLEEMINNEAKT